jgi:hypothetical protein
MWMHIPICHNTDNISERLACKNKQPHAHVILGCIHCRLQEALPSALNSSCHLHHVNAFYGQLLAPASMAVLLTHHKQPPRGESWLSGAAAAACSSEHGWAALVMQQCNATYTCMRNCLTAL